MRRLPFTILILALPLASACGGTGGGAVQAAPAAAAEMAEHAHGLTASAGPGFTAADVQFMQMMMGHHDQATRMAAMAPTHGAGPEVTALAHRIDISQRDEILMMENWLRDRGQPVPSEHEMHAMEMPGMVSPEQFARLGALRGPEFDRLFLDLMIHHHLGAIDMVDALFSSPGAGQDSDIFRFATDVAADQLDEISVMERILDRISPLSRSEPR